jgi:hypothetical protein
MQLMTGQSGGATDKTDLSIRPSTTGWFNGDKKTCASVLPLQAVYLQQGGANLTNEILSLSEVLLPFATLTGWLIFFDIFLKNFISNTHKNNACKVLTTAPQCRYIKP